MSEGVNKVMLLGNLGADPEFRVAQNGEGVLKLRLATTDSFLDRNNTRQERTEWHSVVMFGKRAEPLAKMLQKGERIFIEGRIQTSSYEKNGEKRYRTDVVATNVVLNGRHAEKRDDASSGQPRRAPRQESLRRAGNRGDAYEEYDDSNYTPEPGDPF